MPQFNSPAWREHNNKIDIRHIRGGAPKIGAAYQPKPYIQPAIHIFRTNEPPFWKKAVYAVLIILFFVLLNFVLGVKPH